MPIHPEAYKDAEIPASMPLAEISERLMMHTDILRHIYDVLHTTAVDLRGELTRPEEKDVNPPRAPGLLGDITETLSVHKSWLDEIRKLAQDISVHIHGDCVEKISCPDKPSTRR